jgi:hypothetical protein
MKQTRLLEIIREEIAGALNETSNVLVTNAKGETTTMPFNTPDEKIVVTKLKQDSNIKNIKTTAGVNIKEDEELEEDTLNEVPDFGGRYDQQVAAKYGEDQTLEDATRDITDEILKNMGVSRDDIKKDADKAKAVLKAIRSKVVGKDRDLRVAKALEKQTEFDDSGNALQANQTNNAILKALGLKEPGQRGRKASEEKPVKAEKAPKTPKAKIEKVAKTVSEPMGDEEGPSAKDITGDETAKELGNTPEEKKLKFNQFLASVKKNKDDKAKIDGILKLAKDKFKFPKQMMDDLKRSAGRDVQ